MCYNKFMTFLARKIFPCPTFHYENKPDEKEPCVYLSNHAGATGPVYSTLYFDMPKKIWLIGYITHREKSAKFIYHDFFTGPAKKLKWFWKLLAVTVSIFLTPLFKKSPHVKVYHDSRMIDTFRESINALAEGKSLIIFPECPTKFSPYLNDLYNGFVELGKMYYDLTGKILNFYPTYVNKELRVISVGQPVPYDPTVNAKKQRKEIAEKIRDGIVELAEKLPPHKPHEFLTEEWYRCYGQYVDNPAEYFKMFD